MGICQISYIPRLLLLDFSLNENHFTVYYLAHTVPSAEYARHILLADRPQHKASYGAEREINQLYINTMYILYTDSPNVFVQILM